MNSAVPWLQSLNRNYVAEDDLIRVDDDDDNEIGVGGNDRCVFLRYFFCFVFGANAKEKNILE